MFYQIKLNCICIDVYFNVVYSCLSNYKNTYQQTLKNYLGGTRNGDTKSKHFAKTLKTKDDLLW